MSAMRPAACAALAVLALAGCEQAKQPGAKPSPMPTAPASSMKLTSSAFADGQALPAEYTCDGTGRSPPLVWSGAPVKTRSFALVLEDPDAPGGTFRHWGVYDIPAATNELSKGAAQDGASDFKQTGNDFGHGGYGPPCPPRGNEPHHYHFRIMALDLAKVPGAPSKVKDLLDATKGHVLASAELVALDGGG